MSKATVFSSPDQREITGEQQSVAQIDLTPGSYVVMVKMAATGYGVRIQLTAANYEIGHLLPGDTGPPVEIPIDSPSEDVAELRFNPPSYENPIMVMLSAMVGVKIGVRGKGKAECVCSGSAFVENIMMVAIEVDDLTLITP